MDPPENDVVDNADATTVAAGRGSFLGCRLEHATITAATPMSAAGTSPSTAVSTSNLRMSPPTLSHLAPGCNLSMRLERPRFA